MATTVLIVLAVLSLLVLVLAVALYVSVGAAQLHGPLAIAYDGPRAGRAAPRLDVATLDGGRVVVPSGRRQVLLFADHSLMDFEEILELLASDDRGDLPDLVVLGSTDRTSAELLRGLELRVPAAMVQHSVYERFRVRVMPYAVVVDSDGSTVTSGLVNTQFQFRHLAQVGQQTEPVGWAAGSRGSEPAA